MMRYAGHPKSWEGGRTSARGSDGGGESRTYLLDQNVVETVDGGVLEELSVVDASNVDRLVADGLAGELLGAGGRDKDLVALKVTSSSVVLGVRDPPRVVGNEDDGVEDESDGVVELLGGRERLVSAWEQGITISSSDSHVKVNLGCTHTRGLRNGYLVSSCARAAYRNGDSPMIQSPTPKKEESVQ